MNVELSLEGNCWGDALRAFAESKGGPPFPDPFEDQAGREEPGYIIGLLCREICGAFLPSFSG